MTEYGDRVLLVVTSNNKLGSSGKETGFWLSEFAGPFYALKDAGYNIEVASPRGGEAPIDPRSRPGLVGVQPSPVRRYGNDEFARDWVRNTLPLDSVSDEYRALVLVGGHGAMWDFPDNEALGGLVWHMLQRGGLVGAICHGPAGLIAAAKSGASLHGRELTCFSNREEELVGLDKYVPFFLENRLRELGVRLELGEPNSSTVVIDDNLITAQGPGAVEEFSLSVAEWLHQQNVARGWDPGRAECPPQQQQGAAGAL